MAKSLNYSRRGYGEIRAEIYDFLRQYYPDTLAEFGDAAIGSALVEIAAGVADTLGFQADRNAQETQREFAQQRKSLLSIARTNNVKLPGKKAAVTVCNWSVNVPPLGDDPDYNYCPRLQAGAQATGGGKVFETVEDVDFASPVGSSGLPNRKIEAVLDSIGRVLYYTITKQEVVYNGVTKIFRRMLTPNDSLPFRKISLPDSDVLSITSAIVVQGYPDGNPTGNQFLDDEARFHEVDALAQAFIFGESELTDSSQQLRVGNWKKIHRKFLKEFSERGYCELTFGGGNGDIDSFAETVAASEITGEFLGLEAYLRTNALGEQLPGSGTLFIQYRVGGGADTNIGANVLTSVGNRNMVISGPIVANQQQVMASLRVTNPYPGFGGKDSLSIEEIRYLIAYANASQNRCVTLQDYYAKVLDMPGRYGAPFRVSVHKENNKVIVSILGLDQNGNLSNSSLDLLKDNISEWISMYRMVNDYVEIRDGRINNIAYEVKVLVETSAQTGEIISNVALAIAEHHNINKWNMNQDIPLSNVLEQINNVPNVLNIMYMKVYNKTGPTYSPNQIEMELADATTGLINTDDGFIYGAPDTMFEIKYPLRDINVTVVRVQNRRSLTAM